MTQGICPVVCRFHLLCRCNPCRRAGQVPNKLETVTTVPGAIAAVSICAGSPRSKKQRANLHCFHLHDSKSLALPAELGYAMPAAKPQTVNLPQIFTLRILLVLWQQLLAVDLCGSCRNHYQPHPPLLAQGNNASCPSIKEFSTNFTTAARESITSPAAIRCTTSVGKGLILMT